MFRPLPCLIMLLAFVCPLRADKNKDDFFERSVRPVLAERCLNCHGAKAQKGGLRLDSKSAILKGGEEGPVVIPGKPSESRLIAAIHQTGELKMPRDRKLAAKEIAALEQWIAMGIPWPNDPATTSNPSGKNHWAFSPIPKQPMPRVFSQHPVDFFIQSSLSKSNLTPSPRADGRTLVRRLYMDLHGLPPNPSDVLAFEKNGNQSDWEKLIDRLLASPRYGERWGRRWLDIARYADNKGYVFFEEKNYPWAWTYRNYVIDSLNQDLPYDRFLMEQIAADQLELKDKKSLAALGFLTVGGHFMGNTHDMVDDRIDVVTRGLLGLTVACARCHDHKYDPVPSTDYYSLYGVFRSSTEPLVPPLWEKEPATEEYRKFAEELARKEKQLEDFVTARHRDLVTQARKRCGDYLHAANEARKHPPADDFMLIADKGDLNPAMIARWRAYLEGTKKKNSAAWKAWHAYADLEESRFREKAIGMAGMPNVPKVIADKFQQPPNSMKEVAQRYGDLLLQAEKAWQDSGAKLLLADQVLEELRTTLYGPDSPADAPLSLDWGFLSLFPDRATQAEYQKLIKEVEAQLGKGPARAMVMVDSDRTYDPKVFLRGNPSRLGVQVPRQFLEALSPGRKPFTKGSGRLELAMAVASRDNPLTARVLVNRVWMHHFGKGLVGTPGDFGVRGDPPSHPELLDWLAKDFMDNGWSLKKLHKLILTSSTFQQQSLNREEGHKADPENRLLWKQNRQRLEFEPLHDSMLAVSGGLSNQIGGPSFPLFTGERRRAVYGFINRLEFPNLLATFDVPNPASASTERSSTIVAPQALYLMNGPFARDAARKLLASPAIQSSKPPGEKLDSIMLALFSRLPTDAEKSRVREFLAKGPEADAWMDLVHALLLSNEFAFVD